MEFPPPYGGDSERDVRYGSKTDSFYSTIR
jgi:hypothetical protein